MTVKIKYDKHGNVKKIIGDVGRTRMTRAALELWKGNMRHTKRYKLRRFLRRKFTELSARAELAAMYHESPHATQIPYIGLEEKYDH